MNGSVKQAGKHTDRQRDRQADRQKYSFPCVLNVMFVRVNLQVQIYDQTIFESYKSPGQFFHASSAWKIDHFTIG